eukprot:15357893-Ditylum_brightwellii.AAC.1
MKTVPSTKQSNPKTKQAVIAFQQPPPRQLKCGQYHMCKLHNRPSDTTSLIYKLSIPFFVEGTPEEWIK